MAKQLQKLDLTWIGKDNESKLKPQFIMEYPSKSFGDSKAKNMFIHGYYLPALKELEKKLAEKQHYSQYFGK